MRTQERVVLPRLIDACADILAMIDLVGEENWKCAGLDFADAFKQLEKQKTSPPEMYVDLGRSYHEDIKGMYSCHFRALSNVSKEACLEAMSLGIRHEETENVLGVLKKYEDGTDGKYSDFGNSTG